MRFARTFTSLAPRSVNPSYAPVYSMHCGAVAQLQWFIQIATAKKEFGRVNSSWVQLLEKCKTLRGESSQPAIWVLDYHEVWP